MVRLFRLGTCAVLLAFSALTLSILVPAVAIAQEAPATGETTSEDGLTGFRSAEFGMMPEQVRAAIEADFGLSGEAIAAGRNTVERTDVLTARVSDLIEGGGTAQISYVFGYNSGELIQIGISWSQATDPDLTPAQLLENGDVLRAYFLGSSDVFVETSVDRVVDNGLVLFRGSDAAGRSVLLLLQGTFTEADANGQSRLQPSELALLYSRDPDDPDVFRIEEGQF